MFSFDDENLRETAEVIQILNPYARDRTTESLMDHMRRTASESLDNSMGYVSTLGYTLSAYKSSDGQIGVKASVATHMIKDWLKKRGAQ